MAADTRSALATERQEAAVALAELAAEQEAQLRAAKDGADVHCALQAELAAAELAASDISTGLAAARLERRTRRQSWR